jgi:hypothetical protein
VAHKLRTSALLQRKDPRLPVYVVLSAQVVEPWGLTGTTIVEGTANGLPMGRRTIKAWGKGTGDWFVEFTAPFCAKAGVRVGDRCELEFEIADASEPRELKQALAASKELSAAWSVLSTAEKRNSAEHIRSAKTQQTRARRVSMLSDRLLKQGGTR